MHTYCDDKAMVTSGCALVKRTLGCLVMLHAMPNIASVHYLHAEMTGVAYSMHAHAATSLSKLFIH